MEGRDPVLCQWNSEQMRPHLLHCLEAVKITGFQLIKQSRVPFGSRVIKSVKEGIFCICRMPNEKSHEMTDCTGCITLCPPRTT